MTYVGFFTSILVFLRTLFFFFFFLLKPIDKKSCRRFKAAKSSCPFKVTWDLYWVMYRSSWGLIRPLRDRKFCLCLFILPPPPFLGGLAVWVGLYRTIYHLAWGQKRPVRGIQISRFQWSTVMGEQGLKVGIIPEALRRRRLQTSWICLLRADIFSSKPGLKTNKIQIRKCMYLSQVLVFKFDARNNCHLSFWWF